MASIKGRAPGERREGVSRATHLGEGALPEAATALAGEMTVLIPLADVIDRDAELQRLTREIDKLRKERERCAQKLGNRNYVERAPADIVAAERRRHEELGAAVERLEEQQARIAALA